MTMTFGEDHYKKLCKLSQVMLHGEITWNCVRLGWNNERTTKWTGGLK